MRALLSALAVPVFVLGIGLGIAQLVGKPTVPLSKQPTSIEWADRVYSTPHQLAHWLRAHGTTYRQWAKEHPDSAAILSGKLSRGADTLPARLRDLAAQRPAQSSHGSTTALGVIALAAAILGLVALHFARAGGSRRRSRQRTSARVELRQRSTTSVAPARSRPQIELRRRLAALLSLSQSTLNRVLAWLRARRPALIELERGASSFLALLHAALGRLLAWLRAHASPAGRRLGRVIRSNSVRLVRATLVVLRRAGAWFGSHRGHVGQGFHRIEVHRVGRFRAPEAIRWRAPDLAFAAASVLLAVVVAASLALYLH